MNSEETTNHNSFPATQKNPFIKKKVSSNKLILISFRKRPCDREQVCREHNSPAGNRLILMFEH